MLSGAQIAHALGNTLIQVDRGSNSAIYHNRYDLHYSGLTNQPTSISLSSSGSQQYLPRPSV
jgi:hypothetical protein